ncbi:MAG: nucleotidyltransferase domain-containing protein [Nanoarchaeota archaeon]
MVKINSILKEVLTEIKPSEKELKYIEKTLSIYREKIKRNIQNRKINAEVFVGGSTAKGTLIRKDHYDIDVFLRFDKKYKNEALSDIAEKAIAGIKNTRIHGSRDYFRIKAGGNLFFEIVPVRRITNPREAENVTDLSYSHVNYIKKKIKSQKLLDEIMLAKAFCYANNAYGAESYVSGFSGYGLELLIYHYKSFLRLIKEIAKMNTDFNNKIVIDIEKHHKNRGRVLMDLNEAKLKSPIVLIDPTHRQRNVLAALSRETLENFQNECKDFLKKPEKEFFIKKSFNVKEKKKLADGKGYDFASLKTTTNKQEGDIAGSKLLKFYRHLRSELEKFYDIKESGFEYKDGKSALCFFSVKRKPWILVQGPKIDDKNNVARFKSAHRTVFTKNRRFYSKEKNNLSLKSFAQLWKKKNIKKLREMSISKLESA